MATLTRAEEILAILRRAPEVHYRQIAAALDLPPGKVMQKLHYMALQGKVRWVKPGTYQLPKEPR